MTMEPEEIRKLIKKTAVIASFFLVALLLYYLGRDGRPLFSGSIFGSEFHITWRGFLLVYAILITVVMVLAILVQSGRGGGLAGLGGAGGDSFLGARAATPIAKATYVMGALLLFTCMLLARMGHVQPAAAVPTPDREGAETQTRQEPAREEPPMPSPDGGQQQ